MAKGEFARDDTIQSAPAAAESGEAAVQKVPQPTDFSSPSTTCAYEKMDLMFVIDASTSRERVFEHQRELALRLVEHLPISLDDTHVAVSITSFTSTPILRQPLGVGRNKSAVQKTIANIKYRGGSTLTSKAVNLAVEEMQKRRRADAVQDSWERMLDSSARLKAIGVERFGVALGDRVDLRELRHYVGDDNRIYRDNSTERFLDAVLSLLNGTKECESGLAISNKNDISLDFQLDRRTCEKSPLDLIVLFDSSDNTPNLTDPRVNTNRYLLLDLLGSLPLRGDQSGDAIFESIESIIPTRGPASYAAAVEAGIDYFSNKGRQKDTNSLMLIVGNGNTSDSVGDRDHASNLTREVKGLECHAVDSGKSMDVRALSAYTGSEKRVYNYDRNAELTKVLLRQLDMPARCTLGISSSSAVVARSDDDRTYSVPEASIEFSSSEQRPSSNRGPNSTVPTIDGSFGEVTKDSEFAMKESQKSNGAAGDAWQSVFKHRTNETFAAIHSTNFTL